MILLTSPRQGESAFASNLYFWRSDPGLMWYATLSNSNLWSCWPYSIPFCGAQYFGKSAKRNLVPVSRKMQNWRETLWAFNFSSSKMFSFRWRSARCLKFQTSTQSTSENWPTICTARLPSSLPDHLSRWRDIFSTRSFWHRAQYGSLVLGAWMSKAFASGGASWH